MRTHFYKDILKPIFSFLLTTLFPFIFQNKLTIQMRLVITISGSVLAIFWIIALHMSEIERYENIIRQYEDSLLKEEHSINHLELRIKDLENKSNLQDRELQHYEKWIYSKEQELNYMQQTVDNLLNKPSIIFPNTSTFRNLIKFFQK